MGTRPIRNSPRHPISGARSQPATPPSMLPAGNKVVMSALTQPRLRAGMNSCTSGRSTAYSPALPTHPHEEPEDSEKQPPGDPTIWSRCERHDSGGQREVDGRRDEHLAATYFVRYPTPQEGSGNGAETGRQQDHRPLPIGQLPFLGDEGEDVADQKERVKSHSSHLAG